MCDPCFGIANTRGAPGFIACVSLCILSIGCIISYQDLNHTLTILHIYNDIRKSTIRYPLNAKHNKQFASRTGFLLKYVMNQMFWISTIAVFVIYIYGTYTTLSMDNINIRTELLIFWSIVLVIFCQQVFGVLWWGIVLRYGSTLYLKYKFNEVNEKIAKITENPKMFDSFSLLIIMREHSYIETITKHFNHNLRGAIFALYYIGTPGFQIALYGTHHKDIHFYARIFALFITVTCFVAIIYVNLMSTWVSKAAHKSYSVINSYICHRKERMSLLHRMKILSFIEHLSGPEIGFYCYDLFPMNNYEFYQYLYICGSNYFLIMSFF